MFHSSNEQLNAYADGRLTHAERAAVDDHTANCEPCANRIIAAALSLTVSGQVGSLVREDDCPDSLVA